MFSKSCEYTFRAVLYIYVHSREGKKVRLDTIAESIGTPPHFTAKLLQILSRQKIISSVKGPNGGFFIDRNSADIPLRKVVEAIDGPEIFTACAMGLNKCSEEHPCPLHENYKNIRAQIKEMLEQETIQKLGEKLDEGKSFIKSEKSFG